MTLLLLKLVTAGPVEPPERLVPMRWVGWGLGGSVVFGTVLVWAVFGDEGIKPWETFIGVAMGGLLSVLGYVVVATLELRIDCSPCAQCAPVENLTEASCG